MSRNMKKKVQKEYYKLFRIMIKSKLNAIDIINAINTWAVATVRYWVGIINWNKGELDKIDRNTETLEYAEVYIHALLLTGCTCQERREVECY